MHKITVHTHINNAHLSSKVTYGLLDMVDALETTGG